MMKFLVFRFIFSCLFILGAFSAQAQTCWVVGITDGDTFRCIMPDKRNVKVRLLFIDAPEKKQNFGRKAKQALRHWIYKQQVTLQTAGYDKYHRLLATVFNRQGQNINLKMVENGWAWAYRPNTKAIYLRAEQRARQLKRGLWRASYAVEPRRFRYSH